MHLFGGVLFWNKKFWIKKEKISDGNFKEIWSKRKPEIFDGIYTGDIVKGEANGEGEINYNNGDHFVGTFRPGKNPKGDFFSGSEDDFYIYSGKFDNGKIYGKGICTDKEKTWKCEGNFSKGFPDGVIKYTFKPTCNFLKEFFSINKNHIDPNNSINFFGFFNKGTCYFFIAFIKKAELCFCFASHEGVFWKKIGSCLKDVLLNKKESFSRDAFFSCRFDPSSKQPFKSFFQSNLFVQNFFQLPHDTQHIIIETFSEEFHNKNVLWCDVEKDDYIPLKWSTQLTTTSEALYVGDVAFNKPRDNGKIIFIDGAIYEGSWKGGLMHGQGKFYFVNEDIFEGEFKNGKMHFGLYNKHDGGKYEGEFLNGNFHGVGELFYNNGDHYKGMFVNDECDGYGVCAQSNGDVYKGNFKNNEYDGEGTYFWADGDRFEGQWKNGCKHGKGIFYYEDGSREEGFCENDEQHGKTIVYYNNSIVCEEERFYNRGKLNPDVILKWKEDESNNIFSNCRLEAKIDTETQDYLSGTFYNKNGETHFFEFEEESDEEDVTNTIIKYLKENEFWGKTVEPKPEEKENSQFINYDSFDLPALLNFENHSKDEKNIFLLGECNIANSNLLGAILEEDNVIAEFIKFTADYTSLIRKEYSDIKSIYVLPYSLAEKPVFKSLILFEASILILIEHFRITDEKDFSKQEIINRYIDVPGEIEIKVLDNPLIDNEKFSESSFFDEYQSCYDNLVEFFNNDDISFGNFYTPDKENIFSRAVKFIYKTVYSEIEKMKLSIERSLSPVRQKYFSFSGITIITNAILELFDLLPREGKLHFAPMSEKEFFDFIVAPPQHGTRIIKLIREVDEFRLNIIDAKRKLEFPDFNSFQKEYLIDKPEYENDYRFLIEIYKTKARGDLEKIVTEAKKCLNSIKNKPEPQPFPVCLSTDQLKQHTYITGGSGSGKSELMKVLIHGQVVSGDSANIILDPHGDFSREIAEWKEFINNDKLIFVEPNLQQNYCPIVNPFDITLGNEEETNLAVEDFLASFNEILGDAKLYYQMETILTPCIDTIIRNKKTLLDLQRFMISDQNSDLVALGLKSPHPAHRNFFKTAFRSRDYEESKRRVYTRIQKLLNSQGFFNLVNGQSSFDLERAIEEKKTIVFNLSKGKIGRETSSVFGRLIVSMLSSIAYRRASIPKNERIPTFLFIDECHQFITDSIETILNESRKYRVFLVLAQQYIGQNMSEGLKKAIRSNTGIKICGKNEDVSTLDAFAKSTNSNIEDLKALATANPGKFFMKCGASLPFPVQVHDKLIGSKNKMNNDDWEKTRKYQIEKYYRNVFDDVEEEKSETQYKPKYED